MSSREKEVAAKSTAITIVAININLSAPLLVWNPEEKPSPPPKAPPNPASLLCSRTPPMRRADRMI